MSVALNRTELTRLLRESGVIAANAGEPPVHAHVRPWFIGLLQGVAGWFAGIFLLAFIGMLFKPDSPGSIGFAGALLLAAAWSLYYADKNAVFMDQLALALSVAGQFAVAWAVGDNARSGLPVAAAVLLLQCVLLIVMPNKPARVLSAFFAAVAWLFTCRFLLRPGHGEWWFVEGNANTVPAIGGAWGLPLAWLLTWAPLVALTIWLVRNEGQWMASRLRRLARPALTGLLLALALGGIASEPFAVLALGVETMGFPVGWFAIWPLLSVGLAMFAGYCAFLLRSHALLGVAITGALLNLSRFYYLYGTTLLWKSAIMLCTAVVLGALGLWLRRPEERAP